MIQVEKLGSLLDKLKKIQASSPGFVKQVVDAKTELAEYLKENPLEIDRALGELEEWMDGKVACGFINEWVLGLPHSRQ